MSFETSDRAFKIFADAYGKAWSAIKPTSEMSKREGEAYPAGVAPRTFVAPSTPEDATPDWQIRRDARPL